MISENRNLMDNGGMILPEAGSALASEVDVLFYVILIASIVGFVALMAVCGYFLVKYRRKDNLVPSHQITHNNFIEITWTLIPTLIVLGIFFWGFTDYIKLKTAPGDAMEIRVLAEQFKWSFEYKNGTQTSGELVVPMGTPIKLIMSSKDVIHSFYLPNFRIKRDVIPNRYTSLWFSADRTGSYQIFCTEYCGSAHSNMLANLVVKSPEEFKDWIDSGGGSNDALPLPDLGKKLYKSKGCNACHSVDGSNGIGPSWKAIYGNSRPIAGGSIAADDNYLRRAIVNPNVEVVSGYPPIMPTYANQLSDREINGIIEYIKSLR